MFRDRKAFVFDLEGVFFAGDEVMPGGRELMRAVKERGLPHRFITNISRSAAADVRAHMARLGVDPGENLIVGALDRVGSFLRKTCGSGRAYVLGTDALKNAVASGGFEALGEDEEEQADVVVVGLDERLTYRTLSAAARAVSRGARFVAMNPDARLPREDGGFSLGGGAIVAAVRAAAGREPVFFGKPEPFLFEEALAELGVEPGEAVMVGDNLRTDVAGGRNVGMATVWVNRWGAIAGDPDAPADLEVKRVDELIPHLPGGQAGDAGGEDS